MSTPNRFPALRPCLLACCLVVLFLNPMMGQRLSLGLEVSPLLDQVRMVPQDDLYPGLIIRKTRPDLGFGGWLRTDLTNSIAFQAGAHFMSSGVRTEVLYDPVIRDGEADRAVQVLLVQYPVFPLLFHFHRPLQKEKEGGWEIWVDLGSRIHYRRTPIAGRTLYFAYPDPTRTDSIVYSYRLRGDNEPALSASIYLSAGAAFRFANGSSLEFGLAWNRAMRSAGIYDVDLQVNADDYAFSLRTSDDHLAVRIAFHYPVFR